MQQIAPDHQPETKTLETPKRGRPNEGRRDPKTHRNPPDRGTDELRARRLKLVRGGDPNLAEFPLGIIFARELISETEFVAGGFYALARSRVWGRASITASRMTEYCANSGYDGELLELMRVIGEAEKDTEKRAETAWRSACETLRAAGSRARAVTDNIVIFQRFPKFLDTTRMRSTQGWKRDKRDHEALRAGLKAIADRRYR